MHIRKQHPWIRLQDKESTTISIISTQRRILQVNPQRLLLHQTSSFLPSVLSFVDCINLVVIILVVVVVSISTTRTLLCNDSIYHGGGISSVSAFSPTVTTSSSSIRFKHIGIRQPQPLLYLYNNDDDNDSVHNNQNENHHHLQQQQQEQEQRDRWYDSSTATTMILTQAVFIPIGLGLASVLGVELQVTFFAGNGNSNNLIWWYGIMSTLPLIAFAFVLDQIEDQFPALQEVSQSTLRSVYQLLGGSYKPKLAAITCVVLGIIAGMGEELLFRGILQQSIYNTIIASMTLFNPNATLSVIISIVLSSLVFGLFHAVTIMYIVLATIASLYFGTLYAVMDGDLTVPIICHALYDIGALYYAHYTIATQLSLSEIQQLLLIDADVDVDK